jgi:hypothetical protein
MIVYLLLGLLTFAALFGLTHAVDRFESKD